MEFMCTFLSTNKYNPENTN